jgi:hypothetical protein
VLACGVLAGCGAGSASNPVALGPGLERYVEQVEPIRLGVNRLLEGADPILTAYHQRRISPAEAARRMDALERRFADYTVRIAAIEPALATLRPLHTEYAHTYVLEDAYLSALASGLAESALDDLPDTQAAQRAAIIRWRTGLMVLAQRARMSLPADIQAAGRGEIAPRAQGGS